jgi:uncharacterized membrane protein YccC
MMIRQGLPPVLIGLALGLIAAFWTGALLQQFLYEVEPRDPRVFAVVAALLIVTALLAVWLPARRASRLDPAVCCEPSDATDPRQCPRTNPPQPPRTDQRQCHHTDTR